jgi:hypothetical protein
MDSRIPSRRNTSYSSSWARLENFLLGRTLHVHSLSPLTPPPILFDDHSHDDSLTASQLDKIAKELQNFLSVRLTNTLQTVDNRTSNDAASTATGSIRRLRKGFIRAVKASFVELPLSHQQDFQTDENSHSIPKPWGIEIEIQPPESSVNPFSNLTDRSKPQTQKAHILFLSNAKFATSTHYSILLWKAPPSATYTEDVESQTQQSRIDGQDDAMLSRMNASSTENTVSVTSRMLMAHALDFISRFFDCRVSQEAPLCSIRGLNLERMSEAILRFHRSRREENDRSSLLSSFDRFGIDLGFALPTQVLSDIAQSSSTIENGPAPHLNLISLTVPAADVKSLMTGTREGMLQNYTIMTSMKN